MVLQGMYQYCWTHCEDLQVVTAMDVRQWTLDWFPEGGYKVKKMKTIVLFYCRIEGRRGCHSHSQKLTPCPC